jgi:hypothetical protein
MARKQRQTIKNPYTLSHRVRAKNGEWGNWITGTGEWIGMGHVQNQIKMLKRSRKSREMEFKLKYDGKFLNQKGEQIECSFKLDRR